MSQVRKAGGAANKWGAISKEEKKRARGVDLQFATNACGVWLNKTEDAEEKRKTGRREDRKTRCPEEGREREGGD